MTEASNAENEPGESRDSIGAERGTNPRSASGSSADSPSPKFSLGDDSAEDLGIDEAELAAINEALDNLTPQDFQESSSNSGEVAFEDAVVALENVTAERDEYLEMVQRLKADFDNFRRRTDKQRVEQVERAEEGLVGELLAVLDACDAAIEHGADEVEPIRSNLLSVLTKRGLEASGAVGDEFDPNQHDAVLSEPGDGDDEGPVIAEVMRRGYLWNGRVLRAAMVKVKG